MDHGYNYSLFIYLYNYGQYYSLLTSPTHLLLTRGELFTCTPFNHMTNFVEQTFDDILIKSTWKCWTNRLYTAIVTSFSVHRAHTHCTKVSTNYNVDPWYSTPAVRSARISSLSPSSSYSPRYSSMVSSSCPTGISSTSWPLHVIGFSLVREWGGRWWSICSKL